MDKITIDGIKLHDLKKIYNPMGNILHGFKKSDNDFIEFGEAYFSSIKNGCIKGWNLHKKMTLNLIVPIGKVFFVIFDNREKSTTYGNYFEIELSVDNYKRLTVPPHLCVAFKGIGNPENLILNITDLEHDPSEVEKLKLNHITYNWDNI